MNPEQNPEDQGVVGVEAIIKTNLDANEKLDGIKATSEATAMKTNEVAKNTEAQIVQADKNAKEAIAAVAPTVESLGKAMNAISTVLTTMKGEEGDEGEVGPAGPQGEKGDKGADSTVVGPKGADGKDGKDGADGEKGEEGAPGADGKDGKDGATGKDGKDADSKTIVKETTKVVREEIDEEVGKRLDNNMQSMERRISASKSYATSDLTDTQTADTGQIMTKQADGSWAPATASGTGDMLQATYDAAGGAEQVAFASDLGTAAAANTGDFATGAEGDLAATAVQPADISDTAYGAGWNGDTGAASKNAIYDKIETIGGGGAVDSVNTQTGVVVLDTDDLLEGTNKYVTAADVTNLGNLSGTNTGDQDISGKQDILTEGAFVDGDKTKLDGVEALADVTDATNVTAAGALMDSEVTNLAQVKAFDTTDYATAAQGTTADAALPKAGGTMTGDITLGEDTSIAIDPSASADGKYSGTTVAGTGGATIAIGDVVYLDVTAGEWLLADASAKATAGDVCIGIAATTSTDGAALTVLLNGTMRAATFPASIALGAPVYISETAGDLTATQPTTTDSVIRVLGWAVTVEPNTLYLNPSPDYIEHV